MTNWRKTIKIKQFLTEDGDYENVQENMKKIADVLQNNYEFSHIIHKLRNIPQGDEYFSPSDYANKILDEIYDIADFERIWID